VDQLGLHPNCLSLNDGSKTDYPAAYEGLQNFSNS